MTNKQIRLFFSELRKACSALGIEGKAQRDEYRRRIMWEECHAEHLKDMNGTLDFEHLMLRMASDASDFETASKFSTGESRRIGAMIDDCARQVFELSGYAGDVNARLAYILSILAQSGCRTIRPKSSVWWMDLGEDKPMRVFSILDTHRRRLIRRRNENGEKLTIRYQFGRSYK